MKKIFILLVVIITIFSLNACKQDGEWNDDGNYEQFGFTIDRDTDFIEKAVGETNNLKFNIKSNYNFTKIPMYIKYTSDKNGILKLDSITLEQNKEYEVKSPDNILKYTGNEEGEHNLKITLINEKKQYATEEFKLKYGVSNFEIKIEGGTGEYFQGQIISYIGKIVPLKNSSINGYTIKFNTYNGTIKFNGTNIQLGKEYAINDISNFTISTITTKIGQQKLAYTIKNPTVSKDLDIQQNTLANTIAFDGDVFISKNTLESSQTFFLQAIIKKNPKLTEDSYYKTWVTGKNVDPSGITTTNGIYKPYALGEDNQLKIEMKALKLGNYTLNIQLKDEFGNESDIKEFPIYVGNKIQPKSRGKINVFIARNDKNWIGYSGISVKNILGKNLNSNDRILKMDIKLKFRNKASNVFVTKSYTKYFNEENSDFNIEGIFVEGFKTNNIGQSWGGADNVSSIIILTDNNGRTFSFPHDIDFYSSYYYTIPN